MTVNELIFNFRINVESGGVFIIEKDTGSFLKVTKAMLDKIGDMEIKSHNIFDSKVMINIGMNVEELKTLDVEEIKIGTTLELVEMQGEKQMRKGLRGLRGVVTHIDDAAQIHVRWQNGSSLAIIPEVDKFMIVQN